MSDVVVTRVKMADIDAAQAMANRHFQTQYGFEMALREMLADHRIAQIERDAAIADAKAGPSRDYRGPDSYAQGYHDAGLDVADRIREQLK
jgi:hypothetical protein